jgi:hypothetical protein
MTYWQNAEMKISDCFHLGMSIEGSEQVLIERWLAKAAQIKGYRSWTIDELMTVQSQ